MHASGRVSVLWHFLGHSLAYNFAVKMDHPGLYVRLLDGHARPLPLVPNRGTRLLTGHLLSIY